MLTEVTNTLLYIPNTKYEAQNLYIMHDFMPIFFLLKSKAPTFFLAHHDLCSDSGMTFDSDSHCKLFRELMEELMFFPETSHLKDTRLFRLGGVRGTRLSVTFAKCKHIGAHCCLLVYTNVPWCLIYKLFNQAIKGLFHSKSTEICTVYFYLHALENFSNLEWKTNLMTKFSGVCQVWFRGIT